MLSNTEPKLTQEQLKRLRKLLEKYEKWLAEEQPLAAEIVQRIRRWVEDDIE